MNRRQFLTGITGAAALSTFGIGTARAATTLKIGTLFTSSSIWGLALKSWADNLKRKTGGMVQATIYYNGSQGDEASLVAKIKSGQLTGALVSSVGLAKVYKPALALQMPGLFSSWSKLDAARNALKPELEQGMSDAGFLCGGWMDIGAVRTFTQGIALRAPTDYAGKKIVSWRDNDLQGAFCQAISVSGVPLSIPEVLPNLNTGAVNVVDAEALFAEMLQWTSKVNTVHSDIKSYSIGAFVLSKSVVDALDADSRQVLLDLTKVAADSLTTRVRSEDDAAYARSTSKMTVVTRTAEELVVWDELYRTVRARLAQGTFSADLVTRLEAYR